MEDLHLITIDPVSQDLLRVAAGRGLELSFDRFQDQQPQDGFLRLGLACPFGCLAGPCRIDPFGRGARAGICGLDREEMVAAGLLRLAAAGTGAAFFGSEGPDYSGPAGEALLQAAGRLGGGAPDRTELAAALDCLDRPGESAGQMITRALRLGLLCLGLGHPEALADSSAGWGLLADGPALGVSGRISAAEVERLVRVAAEAGLGLVSLGDWIPGQTAWLPLACSSGEAELALVSGRLAGVVKGRGADPAVVGLARRLGLAVIGPDQADPAALSRTAADRNPSGMVSLDPAWVGRTRASAVPPGRLAVLAGRDHPLASLGHLATQAGPALKAAGFRLAASGDAAVWLTKSAGPAGGEFTVIGPSARNLAELAPDRSDLAGVVYMGFQSPREVTEALGLAALGQAVYSALPLPLLGFESRPDPLTAALEGCGGRLVFPDHPAFPDQILDFFGVERS